MPSPEPYPAELSNRMIKRLEILPRASLAALKQEDRRPCLPVLVARRMINEVSDKPPARLVRD